jgi:hypothetical protein
MRVAIVFANPPNRRKMCRRYPLAVRINNGPGFTSRAFMGWALLAILIVCSILWRCTTSCWMCWHEPAEATH